MKGGGGGSSYVLPAKRRWKGLVIGVLGLVFLSMLVPLVFLLGLHKGFHSVSGYVTEQRSSTPTTVRSYDQHNNSSSRNQSEDDQATHVDDLIRRLGPTLPKDFRRNFVKKVQNETIASSVPTEVQKSHPITNSTRASGTVEVGHKMKDFDENDKLCEIKCGSYCLWRVEHREKMKDSMVKNMKDLLYVARAYYPSIAKLPALDKLSHELKQNIQDFERILSETTTDKDLPPRIEIQLHRMGAAIAKAKSFPVDCNNVDKKLRQLVDLTEDEANFHAKQSSFLYQLAVQTMPKSLHCLSMRLTMEYFRSPPDVNESPVDKYLNPELHHYVILSINVLASSVLINSSVMHAKESRKQVFHVLTDRQNYFAMKLWFSRNTYKEATVQVLNIEDIILDGHVKETPLYLSLPEEFRVSFRSVDKLSITQVRTEYISVFSHSHYLLPEVFQTLKKVIVLDDDVIIQRDLSDLWNLDMDGKVNGAVEFCMVRLGQLNNYMGKSRYDENSCAWMSGINIIDLVQWKKQDLTAKYQRFMQELNTEEGRLDAASLRANLLTFQGAVHALDDSWVISGLGHDYGVDTEAIKKAAVLHFNGNMKPWLELGIQKYRGFWRKHLNRENQFLGDCNVNP